MPFIPIDNNHFINTKNVDYVGMEILDGELVLFVKSGGDKLIVAEGNADAVMNMVRNQGKDEGNWVGR